MRRTRNRALVAGMLELRNPVVTENMIDFLLQDGVCEMFVSFITQVPEERPRAEEVAKMRPGPRPEKGDRLDEAQQKALSMSFNAMMLL
eukprot:15193-Eustigmatos_ZCMA.PRE.1